MITKETVNQIVAEFLKNNSDFYAVDISVSSDNRIAVEIDSFTGVSVAACEKLNRFIEQHLDRNVEDYELEVSSAGLTSPFKTLKQYQKNISKDVETLTLDGRKLKGILIRADENDFTIGVEKMIKPEGAKRKIPVTEEITLKYKEVKYTKYNLKF